jgi:hypothetical protein
MYIHTVYTKLAIIAKSYNTPLKIDYTFKLTYFFCGVLIQIQGLMDASMSYTLSLSYALSLYVSDFKMSFIHNFLHKVHLLGLENQNIYILN